MLQLVHAWCLDDTCYNWCMRGAWTTRVTTGACVVLGRHVLQLVHAWCLDDTCYNWCMRGAWTTRVTTGNVVIVC